MGDAHVTAAIEPQPTSNASSLTPVRSTIAFAAGPTLVVIKSKINLIPAKPIPNVKPDLNARVIFKPKINPMMVMMTGNITVGPASIKKLKTFIMIFIFSAPLIRYYFNKFKISSIVLSAPIPVRIGMPFTTGTLPV